MKRFSNEQLRRLRNDMPVRTVIETLLQLPYKEVEGAYRFLCPVCNEFNTGLNPRTNLARCFGCEKNFNPIELVMAGRGLSFVQSVKLLLQAEPASSVGHQRQRGESEAGFAKLAEILQQQFSRPGNPYSAD